jgi:glucuronate isomerase
MINSIKPFLDANFLLESEVSVLLFHQYASPLPILDYHNHLSPADVSQNRKFNDLTEAWLEGDHYKWRAMRINGVPEKFCTGDAPSFDKFNAWSKTVPQTLRNPLYHWTHLELRNYFGVGDLLNESTAGGIYDTCSALLQQDDFRVQSLLRKMNVNVICTTDDPADSLEHHQQFAGQAAELKMFPSFRPDKAYAVTEPIAYNTYLERLSETAKIRIHSFDTLITALESRMNFFDSLGCRSADHGLDTLYFDRDALSKAPSLFRKVRDGKALHHDEASELKCAVLMQLCLYYHKLGWVQQFHLGALRNNSTRMAQKLGADTGFDSIGDFSQAQSMSKLFDHLDSTDQLAKTILYNSNPADNEVFATMAGNFSDGSVPGKIQWGSGWWFLDQQDGMKRQMNALSNMGLLSRFIGMVTDSRSFLSFPRHEYFRRVLCNLIGEDVVKGLLPNDVPLLGKMIQDICYYNARDYFKFD